METTTAERDYLIYHRDTGEFVARAWISGPPWNANLIYIPAI